MNRIPIAATLAALLVATGAAWTLFSPEDGVAPLAIAPADADAAAPPRDVPDPSQDGPLVPPIAGAIAGTSRLSEPTIEISPDGRIFVTAIRGAVSRSPIFELVDGAWVIRGNNLERAGEIGGGDADLEFDALGRAYHSDLWLGNDGISFSTDGIKWTGLPVSHYAGGNDRQWFAHFGSKYLYIVTNHLAAGAMAFRADISTPLGEAGAPLTLVETPLGCRCGPPGFPSVDQNTGRLFVPLDAWDGLRVYYSPNHGLTWGSTLVRETSASTMNIFPVTAVDENGWVYLAWSEEVNGQYDVFLSVSRPGGLGFGAPTKVSSGAGTHIFPWIVAGEQGKIAVVWYTTDVVADPNDLVKMENAEWRVRYAESLDATGGAPTFRQWDLTGTMHVGTISTQGLTSDNLQGEGPDRSLGDFFSAALNPVDGSVWVAFVNNAPTTPPEQHGVWVERMPSAATPLT